jgi:hypothetical protein
MTGYFVRMKRDGEWQNLDVAELTDAELEQWRESSGPGLGLVGDRAGEVDPGQRQDRAPLTRVNSPTNPTRQRGSLSHPVIRSRPWHDQRTGRLCPLTSIDRYCRVTPYSSASTARRSPLAMRLRILSAVGWSILRWPLAPPT